MSKKNILITGGNAENGIGLGVGKRFKREGWRVIVLDIVQTPSACCNEVVSQSGGKYYSCDISNKQQVDEIIADVHNTFGSIDALFGNAGVLQWRSFTEYTEQEIDRELTINLKGMILVAQPIVKKMMQDKNGVIIFNASMGGKESVANQAVYAASKGGVIQLAKTLSKELGPYSIRVNSVCPGIIDTNMAGDAPEPSIPWIKRTPLNRYGTPDDVASVVWFLANDDARYMTGQSINITGGMMTF